MHTVATAPAHIKCAHAGQKPVVVVRTLAGVKMRPVASLVAYERDSQAGRSRRNSRLPRPPDGGSGERAERLREFLGSVIVSADEAEIRLSESGAIHHQCRAVAAVEEHRVVISKVERHLVAT